MKMIASRFPYELGLHGGKISIKTLDYEKWTYS